MGNESLVIKPKRPKGEDGYKVFSVRVREDIVEKSTRSQIRRDTAGMN